MRIVFYETKKWEEEYLKEKLPAFDLVFNEGFEISSDDKAEVLCNFVDSPVTQEQLKNLPKLKFIATRSTGFDHIDLKACQKKGVQVSNVPTYGENTVAEFTFALLLALSRKIYPSLERVKEKDQFDYEGLQGFDLKGKTLGVVGTGHIGVFVVKIAFGFGMNIVAFDPHPKQDLIDQFHVRYMDLENLLKTADIVTLHVPSTPSTHHLLNAQNIKQMKKGSILINTARGGLVETAALAKALKEGHLAGAAMDVLEEEGFIKDELKMLTEGHPNQEQLKTALIDHELIHMENVLITPHNAFNTKEALVRILDTTVANIEAFVKGQPINLAQNNN
jgi:D-lactate dehydrogenase